jgi:prevent-host-death family protein
MTINGHIRDKLSRMAYVSVAQAKSHFASLIARAESGEKIVITRNGKAVACLGPLNSQHAIEYGELRGVPLAEDLSLPEAVVDSFEPTR